MIYTLLIIAIACYSFGMFIGFIGGYVEGRTERITKGRKTL